MEEVLERLVDADQAYDFIKEGGGINCAELRLVLKGRHGAVQFVLFTGRYLRPTQWRISQRIQAENPHLSKSVLRRIRKYCGPFQGDIFKQVVEWSRFINRLELDDVILRPMGADVGYHSPVPIYEGQEPCREIVEEGKYDRETKEYTPPVYGDLLPCPYLDGACYYDGSGLAARELQRMMLSHGEEAIWQELICRYQENLVPKP